MPLLAIRMNTAEMPPLAHPSFFEVPFVCNPASKRDQINTQLENQSAEDARPAACILSYTHTRPSKSRKECVIQKIHSCRMRVRKCTRPAACILSYTHTRPRKSRKECVIEKLHSRRTKVRK